MFGTPGWIDLEKTASGCSVATASTKMIVSAASRMFSAISFGVFCRFAPSTRAIIRSMKLSPGLLRDLDDDPVRQHLGAAGHRAAVAARLADHRRRLTGDGRLVDARDALDHVAVAGHDLAGLDDHVVALLQLRGGRPISISVGSMAEAPPPAVGVQPTSRRAMVSRLARRSVSAWAFPRPSATASARLAKMTVSQSHTTMSHANVLGSRDREDRGPGGADLDDEHDRVAPQRAPG